MAELVIDALSGNALAVDIEHVYGHPRRRIEEVVEEGA
jgi:hypothetical protein